MFLRSESVSVLLGDGVCGVVCEVIVGVGADIEVCSGGGCGGSCGACADEAE